MSHGLRVKLLTGYQKVTQQHTSFFALIWPRFVPSEKRHWGPSESAAARHQDGGLDQLQLAKCRLL